MTKPIYVLFLARNKEAWHQLSQEEKDTLMAKNSASLKQVGAEPVILCDSSWSSEKWMFFGILKFPDIGALKQHSDDRNEMEWHRYVYAESLLGAEWESQ